MSTRDTGLAAEARAAQYLEDQLGFTILDRNWRNRWCEIDLVARSQSDARIGRGTVHFVEVKYRRSTAYGFAAEYISYDKQHRLTRAAAAWCQAHGYRGAYQIDIITVEGELSAPAIG